VISPQRRKERKVKDDFIHHKGTEKKYFSAAKLAKMRKINNHNKVFFALFAFFAAKDILKFPLCLCGEIKKKPPCGGLFIIR
jgi:hypothetical protein